MHRVNKINSLGSAARVGREDFQPRAGRRLSAVVGRVGACLSHPARALSFIPSSALGLQLTLWRRFYHSHRHHQAFIEHLLCEYGVLSGAMWRLWGPGSALKEVRDICSNIRNIC